MINIYSNHRDGDKALSGSFRVGEFASRDGSDTVLIDSALVGFLQRIRNWAGAPVRITSGYRTPAHNAKVGGAKNSYHTKGRAADIVVTGRSVYETAAFAEAAGIPGIERNEDKNYVHIDTRPEKYYWRRVGEKNMTVSTFGGRCPYAEPEKEMKLLSSGEGVRWLQFWLGLWGYGLITDGQFGGKTEAAVRDLQKKRGLKADGIVGVKTRSALKGF